MAGRPASSDFGIGWRNDFFKAQTGHVRARSRSRSIARRCQARTRLMYVRAPQRGAAAGPGATPPRFAFDTIFPVELDRPPAGQPIRITRGFAVPAGDYDVYVVAPRAAGRSPGGGSTCSRRAVLQAAAHGPGFLDRRAGDQHRHAGQSDRSDDVAGGAATTCSSSRTRSGRTKWTGRSGIDVPAQIAR